ncbi:hypothetical protein [Konateibacter massiliensis]|uniref:hypothetical protein n=1 Tax=Konateibacter massiliensis TaxID=2002841 RepID=UPI000C1515A2|nr:hypothetical protein [Konateibacter massiliensis]
MPSNEFNKCNFCRAFDEYEGCRSYHCNNKLDFVAVPDKLIEKAKEKAISVTDVIALLEIAGNEV